MKIVVKKNSYFSLKRKVNMEALQRRKIILNSIGPFIALPCLGEVFINRNYAFLLAWLLAPASFRAHVAVRSEETGLQESVELPGRMDLFAFVSNTTVDLEGLSHNVNFQFEIELGDPEVLVPGLVLLLENPSAGPSFLNPVVRKINIDDGEGLAVDLQELTSADVDTTREETASIFA